MINRYSVPKIDEIFGVQNKYEKWLKIEKLLLKYLESTGTISADKYAILNKELSFTTQEVLVEEEKTKHDFVAFLNVITRKSSIEEKKWIHYGLTTTDVVDTANSLLIREVNDLLSPKFDELLKTLKGLAFKYRDIAQIGRTHGIHAELTSFGHQFATYYSDLIIGLDFFNLSRKHIECVKISGSVGTFANCEIQLQDFIGEQLDLHHPAISTQILSRERHASYFYAINLISQTINKMAVNLRSLSRSEIFEINENFESNQIGSSSMPHKKNPISLENISGLTRLINGYAVSATDNIPLWHERDISHSSVERVILLDATTLLFQITDKINHVLKTMNINEHNIKKNIELTSGAIYSQTALMKLIPKLKLSRQEISLEIKKISEQVIKNNSNFQIELTNHEYSKHLTKQEMEGIFDHKYHLKSMNKIYKRVFGPSELEDKYLSEIICTHAEIDRSIDKLASKLNRYYSADDSVTLIAVIDGVIVFLGNLLCKLHFQINLISVKVSFYQKETIIDVSKEQTWSLDPKDIKGKKVLIMDELFDTGSTIQEVCSKLEGLGALDIKVCTLFAKQEQKILDWYGLLIPNKWMVGYGLDSQKYNRNIRSVGVLKKEYCD